MSISTPVKNDLLTRAMAAVAIVGTILLVMLSGTLPQGSRGQLIVDGHVFIVTALATALILRGVYALGFSHARKRLASSRNRPLTA
jgi:hypothetical protein